MDLTAAYTATSRDRDRFCLLDPGFTGWICLDGTSSISCWLGLAFALKPVMHFLVTAFTIVVSLMTPNFVRIMAWISRYPPCKASWCSCLMIRITVWPHGVFYSALLYFAEFLFPLWGSVLNRSILPIWPSKYLIRIKNALVGLTEERWFLITIFLSFAKISSHWFGDHCPPEVWLPVVTLREAPRLGRGEPFM